jgi:hypothetical protein
MAFKKMASLTPTFTLPHSGGGVELVGIFIMMEEEL